MKKTANKTVYLLGNKINVFPSYRSLYDFITADKRNAIDQKYVTVNNVHTMVEGFRNPSFQKIINESFLSIPDGKPLQIVGKLKGASEITRLFGPTVMENFIDWGRQDQMRHFFFGSNTTTLDKLRTAIESKYPGTVICGMVAPPFKPIEQWDNEGFIAAINTARPNFIWVGLGAPKQERWMYTHAKQINGTLFGIGAGFDYLAGNTQHAPNWMKNASLEWAYRLVQEPRRLWKRYFTTIPPFVLFATLELLGINFRKKAMRQHEE